MKNITPIGNPDRMAWLLTLPWSLCKGVKEEVILELGAETWCIYGRAVSGNLQWTSSFALLGTHARNSPPAPAQEHMKTRCGTQVTAETTTTTKKSLVK